MYYEYFGLEQPPFKITPDTSLFFPGGDRGAILDALIYAIVSGEGIVKLVGEVGSGKTTLCRMLEKELPENIEIVYLANPSLSPDNILHAIAFELGLKVAANERRLEVMNQLQSYLLERHAENKQVVVFVEEAQSMPIATLEEIRLLSNLETADSKLLQIVIFGQPELDVMIARQEIRQLKERITYSFYLNPLKPNEIHEYINSRLRACGYRSVDLFNDRAIKAISKYSKGLLRRINILADKSLLAAYAANLNSVSGKQVELAAGETEFHSSVGGKQHNWTLIFGSLLILIAVAVAVPYLLGSFDPIESQPATKASLILPESSEPVSVSRVEQKEQQLATTVSPVPSKSIDPVNATELGSYESITESSTAGVNANENSVGDTETRIMQVEWQELEQSVYTYQQPETAGEPVTEEETRQTQTTAMVNIVVENKWDDTELLEQFAELPPEGMMDDATVAADMTCKLCSTIIYRPLKEDRKL